MLTILMIVYMWCMVVADFLHLTFKLCYITAQETFKLIIPSSQKSVMGDIILVTGAGHGIGRELSLQLARLGGKIVCWDINQESNKGTVEAIEREGGIAFGYRCDISDREEVKKVAEKVRNEVGDPSILINNAGIMPCKPFLKHTPDEIERMFKINVFSHFWIIKEWLPTFMNAGRGHIVAMSSMAGVVGGPNIVPYCSSKFAVTGLMEGLSEELRYGNRFPDIKLTTVHPFVVDTGLAQKPRIRFPSLTPVTTPEGCAEIVIEAMRKDDDVVFVPKLLYYGYKYVKFLPIKCQRAFSDFMDTGADEHDN